MILDIKDYLSTDIDSELKNWRPDNSKPLLFSLLIGIGIKNESWSHDFQILIANEKAYKNKKYRLEKENFLLIIKDYNWDAIKSRIDEMIYSCSKNTWEESVALLQKKFHWEYENHLILD